MKACIFDIKKFAVHDGPGIRVTVFFKGCPLSCAWCHNPEGIPKDIIRLTENVDFDGIQIKRDVEIGRWIDIVELVNEIEKDRVFMEESGGGVTFSGGEPLLQPEVLLELLDICSKAGLHTAVDTSGYASGKVMQDVCKRTDLVLFDLKTLDDEKHKAFTGVSNKSILNNLDMALNSGTETIIRIPLVPGFNDDASEISAILDYLAPYEQLEQVDILPYHHYGNHKYKKINSRKESFEVPGPGHILETRKIFESAGYRVTTGG